MKRFGATAVSHGYGINVVYSCSPSSLPEAAVDLLQYRSLSAAKTVPGVRSGSTPGSLLWCWIRTEHKNKQTQTEPHTQSFTHICRLTGQNQRCGPSWAEAGCWRGCPLTGRRHPDAWTSSYSSEIRDRNTKKVKYKSDDFTPGSFSRDSGPS